MARISNTGGPSTPAVAVNQASHSNASSLSRFFSKISDTCAKALCLKPRTSAHSPAMASPAQSGQASHVAHIELAQRPVGPRVATSARAEAPAHSQQSAVDENSQKLKNLLLKVKGTANDQSLIEDLRSCFTALKKSNPHFLDNRMTLSDLKTVANALNEKVQSKTSSRGLSIQERAQLIDSVSKRLRQLINNPNVPSENKSFLAHLRLAVKDNVVSVTQADNYIKQQFESKSVAKTEVKTDKKPEQELLKLLGKFTTLSTARDTSADTLKTIADKCIAANIVRYGGVDARISAASDKNESKNREFRASVENVLRGVAAHPNTDLKTLLKCIKMSTSLRHHASPGLDSELRNNPTLKQRVTDQTQQFFAANTNRTVQRSDATRILASAIPGCYKTNPELALHFQSEIIAAIDARPAPRQETLFVQPQQATATVTPDLPRR